MFHAWDTVLYAMAGKFGWTAIGLKFFEGTLDYIEGGNIG